MVHSSKGRTEEEKYYILLSSSIAKYESAERNDGWADKFYKLLKEINTRWKTASADYILKNYEQDKNKDVYTWAEHFYHLLCVFQSQWSSVTRTATKEIKGGIK